MICTYCKTENKNNKVCAFCKTDLTKSRPQMNKNISEEHSYHDQPTLATYHTYDLLLLLKHLRAERTYQYKLMQTVRKAPSEANIPIQTIQDSEQLYRTQTAHMKIIEEILIDRLGYKPKRIDEKLLNNLNTKIKSDKNK